MVESKLKLSDINANVYCRIRPAVWDGSGHDMNGEAVAKSLDRWTDTSIKLNTQYMFSKDDTEYKFPKKVLTPEATQEDVYDSIIPPLMDQMTAKDGRNMLFLAYG